jgi:glycosyltransferase involved in cell wall biosynthesis
LAAWSRTKRIDLAIQAAERLGIPLVVAGTGPERARLERLAGKGTTFVGEVDERTAGDLLERCRAFVFCAKEDFGIAPIEANAHGAPVVGFAEGALAETMIDGATATLFQHQDVGSVTSAIQSTVSRSWDDGVLRANATRFSPDTFRASFAALLGDALSRP